MVALIRRNTTIIDEMAWKNDDHRRLYKLKMLTDSIDFKCNFNENGQCRENRVDWASGHPACCCKDCARSTGYLDIMFENEIDEYAKSFNAKTGFWRKGKGCILPRKKRSPTCVTFTCEDIEGMCELRNVMDECEGKLIRNYEKDHGRELF